MKPIFEYMNYREFLHDYYTEKKAEHSFYSYRLFAQKAGFTSPNFLKLVIDGQRNLTKDSAFKFAKALQLNKKEYEYFENLVFFNQSDTLDEKNEYLSGLMKHRAAPGARKIEKNEYSYYSQWFHPVIRELISGVDFKGDFKKLGRAVIPAITPKEAEKSVKLLLGLGFIATDGKGKWWKTSASLTTGALVRSVAVANYHRAMIQMAGESIERFKSSERDIESLTLSVSEETFQLMINKAQDFMLKELLPMAADSSNNDRVVQVNMQIFPLSRSKGSVREDDNDTV